MKKKKIASILFVFAFVFIGIGIFLGISLNGVQKSEEKNKANSAEITDIFSTHTLSELEKQSQKDKLHFGNSDDKTFAGVDGYKLAGRDTYVEVDIGSDEKISRMKIETYPFSSVPDGDVDVRIEDHQPKKTDENCSAATLKAKCDEVMNIVAERFGAKVENRYDIFDKKTGTTIANDQTSSFKKIVDGEAFLTFSIKTKDGEIWQLYVDNQDYHGALLFRLWRYVDLSQTKISLTNIDLSE